MVELTNVLLVKFQTVYSFFCNFIWYLKEKATMYLKKAQSRNKSNKM